MGESKKEKSQTIRELHSKIEDLEAKLSNKDEVMALFVKDMDSMEADKEALAKEILRLKQRLAGYKTSNANYRRKIAQIESDHNKSVSQLQSVINGLNIRHDEIQITNGRLRACLTEKLDELDKCKEALEKAAKPWWKRLF